MWKGQQNTALVELQLGLDAVLWEDLPVLRKLDLFKLCTNNVLTLISSPPPPPPPPLPKRSKHAVAAWTHLHSTKLSSLLLWWSTLLPASFTHPRTQWFPGDRWKNASEASATSRQAASPPSGFASLVTDGELDTGIAPYVQDAHGEGKECPEERPGVFEEAGTAGTHQGPSGDAAGGGWEPRLCVCHGELEEVVARLSWVIILPVCMVCMSNLPTKVLTLWRLNNWQKVLLTRLDFFFFPSAKYNNIAHTHEKFTKNNEWTETK